MEKKKLVCIVCPRGCTLLVGKDGPNGIMVEGNGCPRGEAYAKKEVIAPERTVTTTVAVAGKQKRVSCKTKEEIPKEKIFDVITQLRQVQVTLPVRIGDILVKDIAGTGVDMVATCNADWET